MGTGAEKQSGADNSQDEDGCDRDGKRPSF
jgi:hypothetical protein